MELGAADDTGLDRETVRRALERCWFALAPEVLPENPHRVELLGRRLAVFRAEDGSYGVLDDACPHRGASLSAGSVKDEALACPYHGWRWRGDGSCALVPSLPEGAPIPKQARARSYPAELAYGHVWTCLGEPVTPGPPRFPELGDREWGMRTGGPMDFETDVLTATENFRDLAHLPFVHGETLGLTETTVPSTRPDQDAAGLRLEFEFVAPAWSEQPAHTVYRYIPPLFSATFDFPDEARTKAERCLLSFPRPIELDRTVAQWTVGLAAPYEQRDLDEYRAAEDVIFGEDRPVIGEIAPRWSEAGQAKRQVHTLADAWPLAVRRAFASWVQASVGEAQP